MSSVTRMLTVGLVSASLMMVGLASAADVGAEAHATKGAELLKKKKHGLALLEYEAAYGVAQDPKYLPRIAGLKEDLGDHAGAARAFSEYLRRGAAAADPKVRVEVMGELQRLLTHTGRVTLKCDVEGAEISEGDTKFGSTPMGEALILNPGAHVIAATKQGYEKATKRVTVKADETLSVTLEMKRDGTPLAAPPPKPAAAPAPAPEPEPEKAVEAAPEPAPAASPEPSHGGNKTARWIGFSAAGALAAGAVVTGILAAGELSSYEDKKGTLGVSRSDLEDTQSGARTLTIASVGLGLAAVGVFTVTLLTTGSKAAPDSQRGAMRVRFAGPGLVFEGRY
jgi:hypothetical protein